MKGNHFLHNQKVLRRNRRNRNKWNLVKFQIYHKKIKLIIWIKNGRDHRMKKMKASFENVVPVVKYFDHILQNSALK